SSNAVMTSLSPAVIGEDRPAGAGTFHLRFLAGPNSTGGFCPPATPDPPGPRNCGQAGLSPARPAVAPSPRATTGIIVLMSIPSIVGKTQGPPGAFKFRHGLLRSAFSDRLSPIIVSVPKPHLIGE